MRENRFIYLRRDRISKCWNIASIVTDRSTLTLSKAE